MMPADLVKMRPGVFISKVVDQYRGHLAKHWSVDLIDKAESKHRELLAVYACEPDVKAALNKHDEKVYACEPNVKAALDKHDKKMFFNEAWDCLKGRFM